MDQNKQNVNSATPVAGDLHENNLASVLLDNDYITQDQFQEIKMKAINTGKSVEEIIIEGDYIAERDLVKAKAKIYDVPYIDINDQQTPLEILTLITKDIATKNQAVIFEVSDDVAKIAMADPLDIQKVRYLSAFLKKKVDPYFATPSAIKNVIDTRYGAQISTEVSQALEDVGDIVDVSGTLAREENLQEDIASAPVARIVNMMLEYAVKHKASDVHIEPRENNIVVRYRMSGVLSEKLTFPRKLGNAVVARIKILSNLKIDEHRIPQDGRFQIRFEDKVVDLRVSIMPSIYGEKIVMRLLERGGGSIKLESTGLRGETYKRFLKNLKKTQGIILVTGPTGSGKTVTLASSLNLINSPEVNILTLEDPVEIRIDGITQVQINADVGLTFAKGLRSFLRQDPDIIMVGEIRDAETAELAVQAAMTGHLVLATLHTNSAAGAIPRLNDMGIESFLLSSTINLVAAQRLARKICDKCKYEFKASDEQLTKIKDVLAPLKGFDVEELLRQNGNELSLFRGKGCPQCGDSGYKGRIGIFEAFEMSPEIRKITDSKASSQNLEKQAIAEGMITMVQDGFIKVIEGETTIEEVLRVIS